MEAELPHGLEARLAVVEEALVPGHQDDQGPVSRLVLAPLDLGLQVAPSLQADGLGDVLRRVGVGATNSIIFLFPFCEKSLICLEGKSITPHWGNTILFVPPTNSLVSVSDP